MLLEQSLARLTQEERNLYFKVGIQSRELGAYEIKELTKYPYWFIKVELPDLIKDFRLTEVLERLVNYNGLELDIYEVDLKQQQSVICYVVGMLNKIYELEKAQLSSQQKPEVIAAGIAEFDIFGEMNVIRSLAKNGILEHDLIKQKPYSEIFEELLYNKIQRNFDEKYSEIMRNKQKQK